MSRQFYVYLTNVMTNRSSRSYLWGAIEEVNPQLNLILWDLIPWAFENSVYYQFYSFLLHFTSLVLPDTRDAIYKIYKLDCKWISYVLFECNLLEMKKVLKKLGLSLFGNHHSTYAAKHAKGDDKDTQLPALDSEGL